MKAKLDNNTLKQQEMLIELNNTISRIRSLMYHTDVDSRYLNIKLSHQATDLIAELGREMVTNPVEVESYKDNVLSINFN
jgi:hypothetical protein